jgi:hypothetical protein
MEVVFIIKRKSLAIIFILLLISSGCSNSESSEFNSMHGLNIDKFYSVRVTVDGVQVLESSDKLMIKKIINEINKGEKELATKMEFIEEPNGLITLIGEKEVEVPYFKRTGRALFNDYYIHTEFKFD